MLTAQEFAQLQKDTALAKNSSYRTKIIHNIKSRFDDLYDTANKQLTYYVSKSENANLVEQVIREEFEPLGYLIYRKKLTWFERFFSNWDGSTEIIVSWEAYK